MTWHLLVYNSISMEYRKSSDCSKYIVNWHKACTFLINYLILQLFLYIYTICKWKLDTRRFGGIWMFEISPETQRKNLNGNCNTISFYKNKYIGTYKFAKTLIWNFLQFLGKRRKIVLSHCYGKNVTWF